MGVWAARRSAAFRPSASNLGSGGSKFDLSWKSGTTSTGAWADDGYIFRGGPRFWNGSKVGPIRNFTLQALVDANTADLPTTKEAHYVMSAMWDNFDMALRTEDDTSYAGSSATSTGMATPSRQPCGSKTIHATTISRPQ